MSEFNFGNFLSNLAEMARRAPNDPDVLAHLLTQATGYRFQRRQDDGVDRNNIPPNVDAAAESSSNHVGNDNAFTGEQQNTADNGFSQNPLNILSRAVILVERNAVQSDNIPTAEESMPSNQHTTTAQHTTTVGRNTDVPNNLSAAAKDTTTNSRLTSSIFIHCPGRGASS